MQHINRTTAARAVALALALMLALSSLACFAAGSFSKSSCGVKYNKTTLKIGSTTSESALKKVFGKSYKRYEDNGCTCGYATYLYVFKSKGIEIQTFKKKAKSKEQLVSFTISKSSIPTIGGLKVGDKVSKITKVYGKKGGVNKKTGTFRYTSGSYGITIFTNKKTITKIEIYKELE